MSVGISFGAGDQPSGIGFLRTQIEAKDRKNNNQSRPRVSSSRSSGTGNFIGQLALGASNPQQGNRGTSGMGGGMGNSIVRDSILSNGRLGQTFNNKDGYMGVDGRFYTKGTPGYGVIAAAQPAGAMPPTQSQPQDMGGASYPTFGKTLEDYLGAGGASMVDIPDAFKKTLQDYLSMKQYRPEVWAKDLLAQHDQYNAKMEHRGEIGDKALKTIYSQLGDSVGGLGDDSVERYQGAIDSSTERMNQTQNAMQEMAGDVRQSDEQRRAALLGDLVTGTSDAQAGSDSAMARNTTSAVSGQNNLIDNLVDRQQISGDYFDRAQAGAGFKGAETRDALMADVNDVIAQNEAERVNTLANARNEARAAATGHYGTDYGQWQDTRNAAMEQNNQAYQRALDAYNAEYGQFTDNRNFENTLSQQMYGQYADQQQQAMALAQMQSQGQQSVAPEQSKLNLVLQQGKAAGVPDDLLQAITLSGSRAAASGNIDPEALVAQTMRQMGYDPDDLQMSAAWSLLPQILQAYK